MKFSILAAGHMSCGDVGCVVRKEAHRQAMLLKTSFSAGRSRCVPSSSTKKAEVDRARRVIERDDQVERGLAPSQPGVPRAILMQHHPRQRPPLALAADAPPCAAPCRRRPSTEDAASSRCSHPAEAVVLHQMLVEVLDREALVALAVEPLHFFRPVDGNPLARRLAEPAVQ